MLSNDNPVISYIAKLSQVDSVSVIGSNINSVCKSQGLFDRDIEAWVSTCYNVYTNVDNEYVMLAVIVRELCVCRENVDLLSGFSKQEIQSLIDWITTM